jgi:GGDEF domain-containing protein/EAL domain-containing protein (putative c-di-GMP-specific phosphodiesterase class I)
VTQAACAGYPDGNFVRHHRLRTAGEERDARRPRDLARAWTRALEHITQPEQRLRAIISLARPLAGAQRALVFSEDRVLAAAPGAADGLVMQRLFERARGVLEDELVTPELYVARIAPERPERVALRWRAPDAASIEAARAIVVSCAWALENVAATARPPADLPDGAETLHRLEQLVHDARRMQRPFAVIYVDVETPAAAAADGAARDALARGLRREVRANDHIGHLGGDAFLVLVSLGAGESEAYPAAQRLLRVAAAASADASANVGVAICPDDGVQPDDLIEKASAAALAAASVGGTQPYWYRESAGRMLRERSLLRARLSDGDPGTLLDLRYQPVFDGRTGAPYAVTASASWQARCALAVAPLEYLAGEPDRAARRALERWTIAGAAEAYRAVRAAGLDLRVHLALAAHDDAAVDAVAEAFGSGDAMRRVLIEIVAADAATPGVVESFARRLRALGAGVGVGAWRTSRPPFDAVDTGLLDFVTVDEHAGSRMLAALALASMLAPVVIAGGVADGERARWLARHGATAVRGDGLAESMGLPALVRWASNHAGSVGSCEKRSGPLRAGRFRVPHGVTKGAPPSRRERRNPRTWT